MKIPSLLACVAIAAACWAQNALAQTSLCGTAERHQLLLQQYPHLAEKQNHAEQLYLQYLAFPQKASRALVTIPVVVHVVHDGDSIGHDENISDQQILSQIDALNIDYRKLNPDTANIPTVFRSLAADFEIEFCLAGRTPDDYPSTGIERINGQRNQWTIATADEFKPSTIWDPSRYLNIWVMRLGGTDASTLGYAQFPGMADSTDGVVVDYKAFGTTGDLLQHHNEGKTLTHEVGHWLGLRHIWGDDNGGCNQDDMVPDTPPQDAENYGCPTFPHISCNNGPNGDMFMNYMDYVHDDCSSMFTAGQKVRADFFLDNDRASIVTSNGCTPATVYDHDVAIRELIFPTEELCTNVFTPFIKVENLGAAIITSMLINYQVDGGGLNQYLWQGWIGPGAESYLHLTELTLPFGPHSYYVYHSGVNGGVDQRPGNEEASVNFEIVSFGIGENIPDEAEGFEAGVLPASWDLQNPNGDRTWIVDTSAGDGGSSLCAMFDNFTGTSGSNPRGTRDGLITAEYDFTDTYNPYITFSYAYARKNAASKDSLILYYSLDCGASWKAEWRKTNSALAAGNPDSPSKFIPSPSHWHSETVPIAFLSGQGKVQFKFENYSDWGNNIYIDNFKISNTPVGVNTNVESAIRLNVFPNPSENVFHLEISSLESGDFSMELTDVSGKKLKEMFIRERTQWTGNIDLSGLARGIYLLRVSTGSAVVYKKLVKA